MSWDEENNHETMGKNNNESSYEQQWNKFKHKYQQNWKQYL